MIGSGRVHCILQRIGLITAPWVVACGGQPDDSSDAATTRDSAGIVIVENRAPRSEPWRLSQEPLVEFADLPVEHSPLDPTAIFTGMDGRIVVGDGNQVGWHAVLVYDASGNFLMKFGGPGRGPGEFGGQLWWAGPYRGDSIVAWDRRGPSMKIFGADGGFARDVAIPALARQPPEGTYLFSPGFHGSFSDGSLLTSSDGILETPLAPGPAAYRHLLLAVAPGGGAWDTLGEYELGRAYWDGRRQESYLYGAWPLVAPYGNDLLWGDPATYEYRVLHRDGRTRLIVRRAFTPQLVEDADIEAVVSRFLEAAARRPNMTEARLADLRRTVEEYPRAAAKPAYSSILIDHERNVWIERYRWYNPWSTPPDPQPTIWDVFSPAGEWISEVVVPARVLLLSVSEGRALGVRIDEMDVRHVVVFGLQRS